MEVEEDELDGDLLNAHKEIVTKRAQLKLEHRLKRHKTAHVHKPLLDDVKDELQKKGIETNLLENRVTTLNRRK